ncbi:hypothetical protein ACIBJC_14660 [Streptomyces sp. NPDC050509]|uniref:hypothetical protein n=1 Tax=Streptomyces sp. NPDC050509 TaxID=3365620 RepID=UPI0037B5107C
MSDSSQNIQPPRDLTARSVDRTDGDRTLHGIQLDWTVGENGGADWPPPADWNGADSPYPHDYEVWLNGDNKETFRLDWGSEAGEWKSSCTHWVGLDPEPGVKYSVKIRARLKDDMWSAFTDEVSVSTDEVSVSMDGSR